MNEKDIRQKLIAGEFAQNNGRLIRTVNVLKGKWINLETVQTALTEMDEAEFEQSLIYLHRAEYIKICNESTKKCTDAEKAIYKECEVTLTKKGIDLAMYYITDPAVKV